MSTLVNITIFLTLTFAKIVFLLLYIYIRNCIFNRCEIKFYCSNFYVD